MFSALGQRIEREPYASGQPPAPAEHPSLISQIAFPCERDDDVKAPYIGTD